MNEGWGSPRRLGVAFVALLLLGAVGIGLYSQTDGFREQLRKRLVNALNDKFPAEFNVERVGGSIWGDLTVSGVRLRYQGSEIARIQHVEARYELFPLLKGMVKITRLQLAKPVIRVAQDEAGKWNLLQALATSGSADGAAVSLDSLVVRQGELDVALAADPAGPYRFDNVALEAGIKVSANGLIVAVRQISTDIAAPELPPLKAEAVLGYQDVSVPATVELRKLSLTGPMSELRAAGGISDLEKLDTRLTVFIDRLAAQDVARIMPGFPLKADVSGRIEIGGPLADLKAFAVLAAADAEVRAQIQGDFSRVSPRYGATVALSGFDLQRLIDIEDIAGIVDGDLTISATGATRRDLQARTKLKVKGLRVTGWRLGRGALTGKLADAKATFHGRVDGKLGRAIWDGTIELDKLARYRMNLSVEHLDIEKVAKAAEDKRPLTGELNLKAKLKGRGLRPADMNARATVDFLPSTIGPVALRQGRLVARIAKGRINIVQGRFDSNGTTLDVRGELGMALNQKGKLAYRLNVGDLAPWLSLVGQSGAGRLTLTGEAAGRLDDLHLQGELSAHAIRVDEVMFGRAAIAFDLDRLGQSWPQGTVRAEFGGVEAGMSLTSIIANVDFPWGKARQGRIMLRARDKHAHTHRLALEIIGRGKRLTGRLTELLVTSSDGVWRLGQPAELSVRGNAMAINNLFVSNGDQQLRIDGTVGLAGGQDLSVSVDRLDLSVLRPLLPASPPISGRLSARLGVAGSAAAPQIVATMDVSQLKLAGQPYLALTAKLDYHGARARLDMALRQDARHVLNATGAIPLSLSWAHGWRAQVPGEVDLHVYSAGLSLAALNVISNDIRDVAGQFSLDLRLRGRPSRLQPSGTFALSDGRVNVVPLGLQATGISLLGVVRPTQVQVKRFSAKARKGEIHGHGSLALRDMRPENLVVSLTADRWPAIWTRQYRVKVAANVNATGPLTAPEVNGRIDVRHARLRPDLAFLQDKPIKRDDTIVVVREPSGGGQSAKQKQSSFLENEAFKNLALDLTVQLARDTKIRHPNASLELVGRVRATKDKGQKQPSLVGAIDVTHGWAGFQGRRFDITRGKVMFTGGKEINPKLNIVAKHRAGDYDIRAAVDGTVSKPSLRLHSDPPLDKADILAVLLFGKPTHALESGEKVDLQRQAISITSGYAAAKIGKSVSQALGLERLGIDLEELDFSGGRVGLGRYITPKTRLSFSRDLAGEEGQEVSIEYQLAPGWEINTSTRSDGSSGADIIWRKRY